MNYILDTCVISELVKPLPNENVLEWIEKQSEDNLYLSVITIGEIQKGISKLPESNKKTNLQTWLDNDLKFRFESRILPIDEKIAKEWGKIQGISEKAGNKIPVIDSMIAATGLFHKMVIVTRNINDMQISGLEIFNPWNFK